MLAQFITIIYYVCNSARFKMTKRSQATFSGATFTNIANEIIFGAIKAEEITTDQGHVLFTRIIETLDRKIKTEYKPLRPTTNPPVPIDQTEHDNYLICLEDGNKYKTLKRHLAQTYGLSERDYINRWGLRPDYPMVCAELRSKRSANAKSIKLGKINRPEEVKNRDQSKLI